MTLDDVMQTRRSIRRFRSDPPSREVLSALIEAALSAPSASNQQPWRFLVVRARTTIERMAAEVRASVDEVASLVPSEFVSAFREHAGWFSSFEGAPAVIAALGRSSAFLSNMLADAPAEPLKQLAAEVEHDSGMMSVAMAIQNLLLKAHELGLGASVMTGARLAEPGLRRLLQVQPSWRIAALVPVGYPDEQPARPSRKPLDRVLGWIE